MKRILAVALIFVSLVCFTACKEKKNEENVQVNPPALFTKSDMMTKKSIQSTHRLISIDKIDEDGVCSFSSWLCTEKDGVFNFSEREDELDKISVDSKTEILMGQIMSYDGSYPFNLYMQNTTLDYFIENATKEYDGKKLYFKVTRTDDHADKLELFWDYYFDKI